MSKPEEQFTLPFSTTISWSHFLPQEKFLCPPTPCILVLVLHFLFPDAYIGISILITLEIFQSHCRNKEKLWYFSYTANNDIIKSTQPFLPFHFCLSLKEEAPSKSFNECAVLISLTQSMAQANHLIARNAHSTNLCSVLEISTTTLESLVWILLRVCQDSSTFYVNKL